MKFKFYLYIFLFVDEDLMYLISARQNAEQFVVSSNANRFIFRKLKVRDRGKSLK